MMTRDELYSYCKIFIRLVKMTAGPKTSYEKGGEYVFFYPSPPLDSAFRYDWQTIISDFLSFFFVLISVQRFCQRQI